MLCVGFQVQINCLKNILMTLNEQYVLFDLILSNISSSNFALEISVHN